MKKILILLILLLPNYVQADTIHTQEWIIKLSEYRDYVMKKNPKAALNLKGLSEKWKKLDTKPKEIFNFTSFVIIYSGGYRYDFKKLKKKLKKRMPLSVIDKTFDEKDFQTLIEGGEIINLISIGILEKEYPFKLNKEAEIFKELEFYQISPNDSIGDIGAGNGQFGLIINRIYPDAKLVITEVSYLFFKYIEVQIDKLSQLLNIKNIELIFGKKKDSRLEEKQLSKIIIRNSLHHFSYKDEMLQSIKLSMVDNGLLFIKEATREMDKSGDICEQAMKNEDIEKVLEKNGFVLVEKLNLSEETIFKCVKK